MSARKLTLISIFLLSLLVATAQNKLDVFEHHTDVGNPVKPGSTVYVPETRQFIISGAGANVWADHDEFQFCWKKMKGDFILYAKAEFVGSWVDYHRKVGWMVRKTLDANSPHVNAVEHGDGLTSLQFRRTAGAQTEEHKLKIAKANVLQIQSSSKSSNCVVVFFITVCLINKSKQFK